MSPKTLRPMLTAIATTILVATASGAAPPVPNPAYQANFPVQLPGDNVRQGSIALGDLTGDGVPEIVVGASDGKVYAYRGNGSILWQIDTGAMAIEGKAAIGDVDGDDLPEVVIGAGSTFTPSSHGRLYVLDHLGNEQCHFDTIDITGDSFQEGVFSSPAIADLDGNDGGRLEIVFGAWDHIIRAIHHDCALLWQRDAFDTVWSSPTIVDLDGNGTLEVVVGADSHFEPSPINTADGGRLFVVDGATGVDRPGFPIQIDEVIVSSPAVGDVDGDGHLDIVAGTGNCWGANNGCGNPFHPGVGEYMNAWDRFGNPLTGWPVSLPSGRVPHSSPALADLDEDGELEIIVNALQRFTSTMGEPDDGWVYAWNGDGTLVPGWPVQPSTPADCSGNTVSYSTAASPIVADITGNGDLEVILPSNGELVVWNRTGQQISRTALVPPVCQPPNAGALLLSANWTVSGSAGVGDIDDDGDLELIVAGYEEFNQPQGAIWAWDFPASTSADQPWPVFLGFQDNNGVIGPGTDPIFSDGFESGNTSAWSSSVP